MLSAFLFVYGGDTLFLLQFGPDIKQAARKYDYATNKMWK